MSNVAYLYPLKHPFSAKIKVSGSKSITNRALIIASLAKGTGVLYGASDARDSLILISLLQKLGMEITVENDTITVKGNAGKFKPFSGELNTEDAGTAMRFLLALCSMVPGYLTLKGTERMHQRPIRGLADALKSGGVKISYEGNEGFPPVKIYGGGFKGGTLHIDASVSSQYISALLMIAPLLPLDTEIICTSNVASIPYIDMTIAIINEFGVNIKHHNHQHYFIKSEQSYKAINYAIEGDASSASYMLAVAAVSGSTLEVSNLPAQSLQSDAAFAGILQQMGCTATYKNSSVILKGERNLTAVNINMADMPDTAQTLSVVAAFAKGETRITGLHTLEYKETKRLTALHTELAKMGIESKIDADSICIKGGAPQGSFINTYNDHRMAMAFAVAGARIENMAIEAPETVKKSFPAFWNILASVGIKTEFA